MKDIIKYILKEELIKNKYLYQIRDVGGEDLFYKKLKNEKHWSFTDAVDFYKNSTKQNRIVYKK
jgi:hypothetical protein